MYVSGVSVAALVAAGGWWLPGAVADFDFVRDRYFGPPITVSRASSAYIDDSAGNWTLVPPNTARRSDKGLFVEGAQTNSIRNNSMQGAVLGQSQNAIRNNSMQGAVAGTPGTLPTNWTNTGNATVTPRVVGTGVEAGIDYIDLRIVGTATAGQVNLYFETFNATAAASGQVWSLSSYINLVAGSLSNVSSVTLAQQEKASGGSTTANGTAVVSVSYPSLAQSRNTYTRTMTGSTTASVQPYIQINLAAGAVDFTLRIGLPQLEQAPGAGPVTRTTGTAAAFASGTLPTNWGEGGGSTAGLTRQIAGIGVENGIDYVDLRYFGTTTATTFQLLYETAAAVSASASQLWSASGFYKLSGGSLSNVNSFTNGAAVAGGTGSAATTVPLTNAPLGSQRYVSNATTGTGTTSVRPYSQFQFSGTGVNIDITIRIGWPQLEQWSTGVTTVGGASSPIRTAGTAATRAQDVATATLNVTMSATTLAAVTRPLPLQAGFIVAGCIGADINNYFLIQKGGASGVQANGATNGTTFNVQPFYNGNYDDSRHALAGAMGPDAAISLDGNAPVTVTPSVTPTLTNPKLTIGSRVDGGRPLFGYIERIAVLPYRANDNDLPRLSSLATYGG